MPLVTFNVHNNETPIEGIDIIISNTALKTDNTGIAATRIEKTDTIPYSIAIGKSTLTDTIFNLRKDATIDINLAYIDITNIVTPPDTTGNDHNDTTALQETHSLTSIFPMVWIQSNLF